MRLSIGPFCRMHTCRARTRVAPTSARRFFKALNCKNANLYRANLSQANLQGASLLRCRLCEATLEGAHPSR